MAAEVVLFGAKTCDKLWIFLEDRQFSLANAAPIANSWHFTKTVNYKR
jgi:hypothetical protein